MQHAMRVKCLALTFVDFERQQGVPKKGPLLGFPMMDDPCDVEKCQAETMPRQSWWRDPSKVLGRKFRQEERESRDRLQFFVTARLDLPSRDRRDTSSPFGSQHRPFCIRDHCFLVCYDCSVGYICCGRRGLTGHYWHLKDINSHDAMLW